ncbi:carboxypeptidase-like regulatory domain-containing protein [soil metagenome]
MRLLYSLITSFIISCCFTFSASAQDAMLTGTIKDSLNVPIESASISIIGESGGTLSDKDGHYELRLTPYKDIDIAISVLGYATRKFKVKMQPGEIRSFNIVLESTTKYLGTVTIQTEKSRDAMTFRIEPKTIELMPSVSGNFEDVVKTFPGVVSNNELTSNYSVRGGNYDENLVYVNDIQIYRPFLIRSGEQEGLSFINPDLVSGIKFSSGGFGAAYGDKMSSVLDIDYKTPKSFGGSAYMSLLGAGLHLEGISKNKKFTWLTGLRQKSNQFLLKNLDTQGDYKPSFTDIQGLLTYQLTKKTELSLLGNYSRNKYRVIPSTRQTEFGNINEALRFTVYFDGQEVDQYQTSQGALALTHKINDSLKIKFIASTFITKEQEFYDILGQYYLDELERDLGSSEFGNVAYNRGVGGFLDHARNELNAYVTSAEHKGYYNANKMALQWGVKLQHEKINDELDQWQYRDSADFSIPHPSNNPGGPRDLNQQIVLNNVVKNKIELNSLRYSGYVQNTWTFDEYIITAGVRATYWDLNDDLNISPRASLTYHPKFNDKLTLRAASGIYYQPPFYREMRGLDGQINKDVIAQRSIHFVLASDYQFLSWGREFKLTSELYYKKLDNLNPYKLDNTRIRYLAKNNASGYATGIDLRLNGEFVEGIESWASLSYLKTVEDLKDDSYITYYNQSGEAIVPGYTFDNVATDSVTTYPGNIPRPSDQRITFSLFFQDYLPASPSFRMHMNLIFGTGLPYGPPGEKRYTDILRGPTYRRVDIGFSKVVIDEDKKNTSRIAIISKLKSLIFSLEVFNLLQVSNTVSYTWITDISGRQYGVPNYLTSRLINLRLQAKF